VFFIAAKLLSFLAEPGTDLVLLILLGLIFADIFRWRRGRAFAWLGALGLVALAMLPVDDWLTAPLEARFPSVHAMPERIDGIIVLGGAVDPEMTARHGMPALGDAAERVTTFVSLARRYPDAKLVFSGGSGHLLGGPPEADAAARLFADLGLDPDRVLFERESRDTYENAVDSLRLATPKAGETWVLITSATHMPRAVGVFRKVGWPVLPWPVGYKSGEWHPGGLAGVLRNLGTALHEWIGLAAYYARGRTDALFPGP